MNSLIKLNPLLTCKILTKFYIESPFVFNCILHHRPLRFSILHLSTPWLTVFIKIDKAKTAVQWDPSDVIIAVFLVSQSIIIIVSVYNSGKHT